LIKRRIWWLPYQGFHQGTWGWGACSPAANHSIIGESWRQCDLCKLFHTDTQHGQDRRVYSALLDKLVKVIVAQFGQKNAANLFSGRGGKLTDAGQAVQGLQDFELVTWLVIK